MLFKINTWSHNVYLRLFFHLKCFAISPIYVLLRPLYPVQEKAMATHSNTLAWKIPWMEEAGRLQSMGSLRVRHNWATSLSLFTFTHWRREWQPIPVFLPGDPRNWGAWWAAVYGVAQSRVRLKRLRSMATSSGLEDRHISILNKERKQNTRDESKVLSQRNRKNGWEILQKSWGRDGRDLKNLFWSYMFILLLISLQLYWDIIDM